MAATKVAGVRGEPNPSPTGLGVPQVGTMKGSGVCVGEGGKGQPPCSNGLEDVEGSFCVPSSSSSGFGATAVVSGRDTAVENIGGNEQSSGVLGPRVSCPPTVLNMQSNQDGMIFFSSLAERAITAVPVTALPYEAIVTSSAMPRFHQAETHNKRTQNQQQPNTKPTTQHQPHPNRKPST